MIGPIAGAQELNFRAEIGRASSPIDIRLTGPSFDDLSNVADEIKERLSQYPDLFDIADTYQDGKPEIQLQIKPEAEILGLTMANLARQVRQAFYGAEAQRIQRGRDDVRVMVRYPLEERSSLVTRHSRPSKRDRAASDGPPKLSTPPQMLPSPVSAISTTRPCPRRSSSRSHQVHPSSAKRPTASPSRLPLWK